MTVQRLNALYYAIPQTSRLILPSDDQLDEDPRPDEMVHYSPTPTLEMQIRLIHFVLGSVSLLPWNVMITAIPYFLSRLSSSPFSSTFSSYLSSSFTATNFVFFAYAMATSKQASHSLRIRVATLWLAFVTFLLALSTFIHITPGLFFALVLMSGISQAVASSYLATAVVAVASLFGSAAVQSMMSGQAAVAVVISGVQVLSAIASIWRDSGEATALSSRAAEEQSASIFFGLSTLFLIVSIGAHTWLVTMPAYKAVVVPPKPQLHRADRDRENLDERQGLLSRGPNKSLDEKGDVLRVAKANLPYEIALAYVFIVTLAVFPPITTSIRPTNTATHPLLFSAIHFLVFNTGDFGGRYICSYPRVIIWSANRLLTLSIARTLFIPLFLMCNVQRPTSSIPSSPIINSDFLFMLILFIFGISNGYLSSLCMMSASSLEHNPRLKGRREDVDVAGTIAGFCLVGGVMFGSIGSFAVKAAICRCNPFVE